MEKYDYSRLLGKMRETGHTQANLAKKLDISETSLNLSLNNKRNFKQEEMVRACDILGIPLGEIKTYFFTHKL